MKKKNWDEANLNTVLSRYYQKNETRNVNTKTIKMSVPDPGETD